MFTMSTLKKQAQVFHHGDLHDSLIRAGLKQVEKQGLNSLGLRQLALITGVSPTAVYRHFVDLEHLKAEISKASRELLGHMILDAMNKVKANSKRKISKEKLWAAGSAYIDFGITKPNLFEIAFIKYESPELEKENPSPWELLNGCIDELISDGFLKKEHRSSAPIIAWTAVHGFAALASQGMMGSKADVSLAKSQVLNGVFDSLGVNFH
jgi:AcrR family transcriptional regulator